MQKNKIPDVIKLLQTFAYLTNGEKEQNQKPHYITIPPNVKNPIRYDANSASKDTSIFIGTISSAQW